MSLPVTKVTFPTGPEFASPLPVEYVLVEWNRIHKILERGSITTNGEWVLLSVGLYGEVCNKVFHKPPCPCPTVLPVAVVLLTLFASEKS